jgi:hypothetical protein
LISPRAGLIAAALAMCSPLLIWCSLLRDAVLSALSLLAFVYGRATPTGRTLAAWVTACVLAMATHYFAALPDAGPLRHPRVP